MYLIDSIGKGDKAGFSYFFGYILQYSFLIWGYYKLLKNRDFIAIPYYQKYAVFLRSFNSDGEKYQQSFLKKTSKFYRIVQVGDPSLNFMHKSTNDNVSDYFLPSNNWHVYVSYLIHHSKCIFYCLSVTDGLFWEIQNHRRWIEKSIFYLPSTEIAQTLLEKIHPKEDPIHKILEVLIKYDSKEWYFFFRENQCLYSTKFDVLIKCFNKSITLKSCSNIVNILQLNSNSSIETTNSHLPKGKFYALNIIRGIWTIINPTLLIKTFFKANIPLLGIVFFLGIILLVLITIGLIIYLITLLFDSSDDTSLVAIFLGIIFCIGLLKNIWEGLRD